VGPELGLSYYNYYDPLIGRFTQPDTIIPNPANPQDLNRYTYVRNNPATLNDPSGNDPCPPSQGGGGGCFDANDVQYGRGCGGNAFCGDGPRVPIGSSPDTRSTGEKFARIGEFFRDAGRLLVVDERECVGSEASVGGCVVQGLGIVPWGKLAKLDKLAPSVTRGGVGPVRVGQEGLDAVGVVQNTTRIPRPSGTGYRVPDILDEAGGVIGEVKNVQSLSFTQQLRDYVWYAGQNDLQFDLYVRGSTTLTGPLQTAVDDGLINLFRDIPG